MDQFEQLTALIELARSLGMTVRQAPSLESSDHPGGALVRLKGREIVFLDSAAAPAEQSQVLVEALKGRKELQDRFLAPRIRQLLDGGC